jgi:uncharacterized protein (DUF433 family)
LPTFGEFSVPEGAGTCIPVEPILRKLGTGAPAETILEDHPRLTLDVRAAQAVAVDYLADEGIVYC